MTTVCVCRVTCVLARCTYAPPGMDVSGEVVAVGSAVRRFRVGDAAFGVLYFRTSGSFADFAVLDERSAAKKPSNLTFAEAASLPIVALTGYQALRCVKAGARVLVLGGAGGTGSIGLQLAKIMGASHCVATCSERNVEFVREMGADAALDYGKQQWWEELKGQQFDVVYDCVGHDDAWAHAQAVLKPSGHFATIVGRGGDAKMTVSALLSAGGQVMGRKIRHAFGSAPNFDIVLMDGFRSDHLDALAQLAEAGRLRPQVSGTLPMDQVPEMYRTVAKGHTRGKLVCAVTARANEK